jgi:virulence-associated protein VagC
MPKTAQLITDRGHQVIHLPEDIHLTGTEFTVRQDDQTGEITLSPQVERPSGRSFKEFFELRDSLTREELDAFEIPRDRRPLVKRDIF